MKLSPSWPMAATLLFALGFSVPAHPVPQAAVRPGNPSELNIIVATDPRQVAVSAALLLAGHAGATGPTTSALRERVLSALRGVSPDLRGRLETFVRTHRATDLGDEADAARYRALALLLTAPPSLSLGIEGTRVPADLAPIVGFAGLVGELYRSDAFRPALPALTAVFNDASTRVTAEARPVVGSTLDYLHTVPIRQIDIPAVRDAEGKILRPAVSRTRMLKIYPDPLLDPRTVVVRRDIVDADDTEGYHKAGDRVVVFAGGSVLGNEAAVRVALLRFVLDPIVERYIDAITEKRPEIDALLAASPKAKARYETARLALVEDSLVSAAGIRFRVRERSLGPNGAVVALAEARERGEVLAFHFYEQLQKIEDVGLDIAATFPQLIAGIDPKAESRRDTAIAAARAAAPAERAADRAADDTFAKQILQADELITRKQFASARPLLEGILESQPNNPRALFGLAQVLENTPEPTEEDPTASEEDRAGAQSERLERAVNLYRSAAQGASERERWIASWSHLYAGRILDFLGLREEAVAEYQAAIGVGEVPKGAYREAQQGLKTPYAPSGP